MHQSTIVIVGAPDIHSTLADDVRSGTGLPVAVMAGSVAARSFIQCETNDTALAIIDAGLPDGEGFALCRELAQASKGLPVMMLGNGGESEAVQSLEAGAIDHFARPNKRAELLARLRAHLRSQATALNVEITVGPFTFRPGQRSLVHRRTRARIWLTAKETRLLRRLHLASGRPVPAALLIEAAWNSPATSMHTLHTHVYRLRTKLGAGSDAGVALQTNRDGYALVF